MWRAQLVQFQDAHCRRMQSEYIWDCLSKAKSLPKIERLKRVFSIFFAGLGSLLLWRDLLKARERERERERTTKRGITKRTIPISYIIVTTVSQWYQKDNLYPSFPTAKVLVPLISRDVCLFGLHPLKRTLDRSWSYPPWKETCKLRLQVSWSLQ